VVVKVSDDKKTVKMSVDGTLSVTELETLIANLSVLRANMLPPVPFEPPKHEDPSTDLLNVSVQDDPYLQARLLRDGRIRLWIRNHGLGWLVYNLPVNKACTLRDYLIANTPKSTPGPNLLEDDFGDSGAPH
jgi:hypothetical protein